MATQTAIQDAHGAFSGVPAIQAALVRQSKAYLRAYGDILEVYDGIAQSWIERQRAGIESAFSAAEKISESGNGHDSFRIYNEWIFESLRRFNDDILKLGEQLASIPSKTLAAVQDEAAALAGDVRTVTEAVGQAVKDGAEAPAPEHGGHRDDHHGGEQRLAG